MICQSWLAFAPAQELKLQTRRITSPDSGTKERCIWIKSGPLLQQTCDNYLSRAFCHGSVCGLLVHVYCLVSRGEHSQVYYTRILSVVSDQC